VPIRAVLPAGGWIYTIWVRTRRRSNDDLVTQAYRAWQAEDWQRAGPLLEAAVRQNPDARGAEKLRFDAALAYKFLRAWPKAYELGIQAAARAVRGTGPGLLEPRHRRNRDLHPAA
jgi:hypothetical protein